MFSPGDKVRCVEREHGHEITLNEIYTIKSIKSSTMIVLEEFPDLEYFKQRFELLNQNIDQKMDIEIDDKIYTVKVIRIRSKDGTT